MERPEDGGDAIGNSLEAITPEELRVFLDQYLTVKFQEEVYKPLEPLKEDFIDLLILGFTRSIFPRLVDGRSMNFKTGAMLPMIMFNIKSGRAVCLEDLVKLMKCVFAEVLLHESVRITQPAVFLQGMDYVASSEFPFVDPDTVRGEVVDELDKLLM